MEVTQLQKKRVSVRGMGVDVDSLTVENKAVLLSGRFLKIAALEEEWYKDVEDPANFVKALKDSPAKVDMFTFWQRYPEDEVKYKYHAEMESLAVLPIQSFDHWWKNEIRSRIRSKIRKAENKGVVVKRVEYDDAFVQGMTDIFNETPVRQGRPFWHYGKDFETVKREFSRYLDREQLVGAYYGEELIGFMFLGDAGRYAVPGQILAKVEHRDKGTIYSLIAKSIELCVENSTPHLLYFHWGEGNFSEFKRRCGFKKVMVPRYYVPLTLKARLALGLRLHRGVVGALPKKGVRLLKRIRSGYCTRKARQSS